MMRTGLVKEKCPNCNKVITYIDESPMTTKPHKCSNCNIYNWYYKHGSELIYGKKWAYGWKTDLNKFNLFDFRWKNYMNDKEWMACKWGLALGFLVGALLVNFVWLMGVR